MPDKRTLARVRRDKEEGKSPSTQAGEFIREEFEHIRAGVHGARSTKQAIAIGLSKARRAGVKLPSPPGNSRSKRARVARNKNKKKMRSSSSRKRSEASLDALRREGWQAGSAEAISKFARASAKKRGPQSRHRAAQRPAQTRARQNARKSKARKR